MQLQLAPASPPDVDLLPPSLPEERTTSTSGNDNTNHVITDMDQGSHNLPEALHAGAVDTAGVADMPETSVADSGDPRASDDVPPEDRWAAAKQAEMYTEVDSLLTVHAQYGPSSAADAPSSAAEAECASGHDSTAASSQQTPDVAALSHMDMTELAVSTDGIDAETPQNPGSAMPGKADMTEATAHTDSTDTESIQALSRATPSNADLPEPEQAAVIDAAGSIDLDHTNADVSLVSNPAEVQSEQLTAKTSSDSMLSTDIQTSDVADLLQGLDLSSDNCQAAAAAAQEGPGQLHQLQASSLSPDTDSSMSHETHPQAAEGSADPQVGPNTIRAMQASPTGPAPASGPGPAPASAAPEDRPMMSSSHNVGSSQQHELSSPAAVTISDPQQKLESSSTNDDSRRQHEPSSPAAATDLDPDQQLDTSSSLAMPSDATADTTPCPEQAPTAGSSTAGLCTMPEAESEPVPEPLQDTSSTLATMGSIAPELGTNAADVTSVSESWGDAGSPGGDLGVQQETGGPGLCQDVNSPIASSPPSESSITGTGRASEDCSDPNRYKHYIWLLWNCVVLLEVSLP